MDSIARSELFKKAEELNLYDYNDYVLQFIRENPTVEIINDLKE